jgi:hypothetical protein
VTTPQTPPLVPVSTPTQAAAARTRVNIPYLLVGVLLAGVWALGARHRGDVSRFVGAWLGSLVWPALIAYIARGRKGDWRAFSRWFFWLALLIPPALRTLTHMPAR